MSNDACTSNRKASHRRTDSRQRKWSIGVVLTDESNLGLACATTLAGSLDVAGRPWVSPFDCRSHHDVVRSLFVLATSVEDAAWRERQFSKHILHPITKHTERMAETGLAELTPPLMELPPGSVRVPCWCKAR